MKVLLILLVFTLFICKQSFTQSDAIPNDSIIEYANSYLGTKYVWGASSPSKGFDCSGFVHYVFKNFDISVPRSSKAYDSFENEIPLKEAQKGDLILFTGTNPKDRRTGHLGIVISNKEDELVFIHSSSSKKHFGVVQTEYYSSGYPKRFLRVVRIEK